ncbi:hypothetical protein GCM10011579_053580 [Streptomyces albiflavescens]|uniref:Uncharacterized protein n=1 Tax=Streptomyces albiflavescens TaxID=1623582 RepID=A0A917Y777_9ACTN|nr:hypothetical protein GCM10011579_053580 [Streptomyces albiflavescens]
MPGRELHGRGVRRLRGDGGESADQVTVKVTEKPWKGKVCIMITEAFRKTVSLDEPLGDRKVVGSDGKEIPEGRRSRRGGSPAPR